MKHLNCLLEKHFSEYATSSIAAYDEIASFLAFDPVEGLRSFSENSEAYILPEGFKHAMWAYGAYLLDDLESAIRLASVARQYEPESAFIVETLARYLTISKGANAGLSFIHSVPQVAKKSDRVLGRLIGLLAAQGRDAEANSLIPLMANFLPEKFQERVKDGIERFDKFILMNSTERETYGQGIVDTYSYEENQKSGWKTYQKEYSREKSYFENDTMHLAGIIREEVKAAIEQIAPKQIINFGTLYGGLEVDLAMDFPDLMVIGYDRSPVAKKLNEKKFRQKNLRFLDGDYKDAVAPYLTDSPSFLYHSRTTVLMFPDQIVEFYKCCSDMGITRIAVIEGLTYSESTYALPSFTGSNRQTIPSGGHMMLHNYDYYLENAGYRIERKRRVPMTCHPRHTWPGKHYSFVIEVIIAELQ